MAIPNHVYVLSNGSNDKYPDNSLTQFKNQLPNTIDLEGKNVVVSLQAIGFSCDFRNLKVPENINTPSIIVTECGHQPDYEMCVKPSQPRALGDGSINQTCSEKFFFSWENTTCYKKEYFFEDRWYTENNLKEFLGQFQKDGKLILSFRNNKFRCVPVRKGTNPWILIHPTFAENFKIDFNSLTISKTFQAALDEIKDTKPLKYSVYLNSVYKKTVEYKNEFYLAFQITNETPEIVGKEVEISKEKTPEIIKVSSSIISSQILNNEHSKDLLCFCPDYKNITDYYFKEFEQLQKIKLANTNIRDIDISLRDEKNNKLQLLPGIPTYVKLKFEVMPPENKNFNVRLTSAKSEFFPNNTKSVFKVKLPNSLYFNKERDWKVALTSISHPNIYSTFPDTEVNRTISFKPTDKNKGRAILTFADDKTYEKEEIANAINKSLQDISCGWAKLSDENLLEIHITVPGVLVISNAVLDLLGYQKLRPANKKVTIWNVADKLDLVFTGGINLGYLKPDYIIAYCNIVQPSIIGGNYANILRIIPILKDKSDYMLQEFKNKNFLSLLNTEVSEIEINFRSHDGLLLNFFGKDDVILNLEFSNSE